MDPFVTCATCGAPIGRVDTRFGLAPAASICPACTPKLRARQILADTRRA